MRNHSGSQDEVKLSDGNKAEADKIVVHFSKQNDLYWVGYQEATIDETRRPKSSKVHVKII